MPGRGKPALLEREAELAGLEAALNDARRGAGRLVVIEGSAGIGKTRLWRKPAIPPPTAGCACLSRAGPSSSAAFLRPRAPGLRARAGGARAGRARAVARGRGAPRRSGRRSGSPPDAGSPADPSFATLNALYWLISNL